MLRGAKVCNPCILCGMAETAYKKTKIENGYEYRGFHIEPVDDPYTKWWVAIPFDKKELRARQQRRIEAEGRAGRIYPKCKNLKDAMRTIDRWHEDTEKYA